MGSRWIEYRLPGRRPSVSLMSESVPHLEVIRISSRIMRTPFCRVGQPLPSGP